MGDLLRVHVALLDGGIRWDVDYLLVRRGIVFLYHAIYFSITHPTESMGEGELILNGVLGCAIF